MAKNFVAFVKKKFEDFNVMYGITPSFLKEFINEDDKIIFVCKISNFTLNSYISPIKRALSENRDLDLTGSPLKDDCEIEPFNCLIDVQLKTKKPWSANEENFQPIEVEKVRALMSDNALQEEGKKLSYCGSIWFLCKPSVNDNTILMSLNFKNGYNSIGFIKYNDLLKANFITSENLMLSHHSFLKDVNQTNTSIENCYNIKPNIFFKLNWSTSDNRPQLINIKTCNSLLCQNICVEGSDSVLEHFWRQLTILNIINADILNLKNNHHIENEISYKCGRGIDVDILKENIIEAMTELPSYCCNDENDFSYMEPTIIKAKNRTLTDITDKLWEILKCCSSYKDLKIGFTHIFQCAAQRNIINMPINENSLAKIICEVAKQRLAIPCLTGTEPLELLLEIGLEKLRKDYEYILAKSKICGLNDLQKLQNREACNELSDVNFNVRCTLLNSAKKFGNKMKSKRKTFLHNLQNNISNENIENTIGVRNSKYNEREVELNLAKLCQIHIALEHLLSIQINLNLQNVYNQIFEQLLQRPLQPFPGHNSMDVDSIAIPVLTEKILGLIENKTPDIRKIVIVSYNKFKNVKTTFYYNTDNIYPPNIFDTIFNVSTDQKESKNKCYYSSIYVRIRSEKI